MDGVFWFTGGGDQGCWSVLAIRDLNHFEYITTKRRHETVQAKAKRRRFNRNNVAADVDSWIDHASWLPRIEVPIR